MNPLNTRPLQAPKYFLSQLPKGLLKKGSKFLITQENSFSGSISSEEINTFTHCNNIKLTKATITKNNTIICVLLLEDLFNLGVEQ